MSVQIASASEPHVLVIGGGFGGVAVSKALRDAPVKISLIDKSNHHLFQPLLYQVATSILSSTDIATPLRQIFRDQKNVTVFLGEVTSIDLTSRTFSVDGEKIPIPYDYLVVAVGAQQSYFGHDEFEAHAPAIKSLSDAEYLRNKILSVFEVAERKLDPSAYPELLTFVLVGGGATGVELSAAICAMARRTLASEFRRYDPSKLRVILVHSGPRILPQFPEALSAKALQHLQDLGVEVRLNSRVTGVDADGVTIGAERIASKNVVWTAGVAPHPLVRTLGLTSDRSGRVVVQGDCSVPGHPEVFIIGDAASFSPLNGKPLPGVAQVALQQGTYVGRLISRKIAREPAPKPFHYFDKGNLAVIGPFYAVIDSFGIRSTGFWAFWVWIYVHLEFLPTPFNRLRTAIQWIWTFATNLRTGCLIIPAKKS
jgi:NADH dehydrogenase FAD-containing subunit